MLNYYFKKNLKYQLMNNFQLGASKKLKNHHLVYM